MSSSEAKKVWFVGQTLLTVFLCLSLSEIPQH